MAEESPGMSKTELLRTGTSANTFFVGVEFQQENTHRVPRESALLAAFKSHSFREILRPKEGLRMTVFKN